MNELTDRELSLDDEDRLPWLEAVDSDDEEGVSTGKLVGLVLAGLLALAVVGAGIWWINKQKPATAEDGTLITAQEGDYKVKADDAGGMKVEGQGDTAFATSEGGAANGTLDMGAQPEAPVAGTKVAAAPITAPVASGPSATAPVGPGGTVAAIAPKPAAAPVAAAPAASGGSGQVQIGAYGSEAEASAAWNSVSRKVPALSGMNRTIVPAVVNGKNWFRVRVGAGNPADLCAKIKAGGGSCMVVK